MGDTKISWLKSCSRSARSEISPCAVDCQIVMPSTPVKTKWSRFTPARSPKPVCRLVPRIPMKMTGNANSAIIRWRSRRSFVKSRWAITRMAEASLARPAHDLEVCILEARRMRLHDGEGSLDAAQDRVDGVAIELDLERSAAARRMAEPGQLVPKRGTIGRVDEEVLLDKVALDVVRGAERHDLAFVDDADTVRLFRFL